MASDDDYCTCCDLPPESCGKAAAIKQDAEKRKVDAELLTRGWFRARFPGICVCGEDFEAGTLIRGAGDYGHRQRKYFAECCAEIASRGSK